MQILEIRLKTDYGDARLTVGLQDLNISLNLDSVILSLFCKLIVENRL